MLFIEVSQRSTTQSSTNSRTCLISIYPQRVDPTTMPIDNEIHHHLSDIKKRALNLAREPASTLDLKMSSRKSGS